jgi:hypothetical protein
MMVDVQQAMVGCMIHCRNDEAYNPYLLRCVWNQELFCLSETLGFRTESSVFATLALTLKMLGSTRCSNAEVSACEVAGRHHESNWFSKISKTVQD